MLYITILCWFFFQLEEAEKRHEIMVNIMKKEIEHGQRMVCNIKMMLVKISLKTSRYVERSDMFYVETYGG